MGYVRDQMVTLNTGEAREEAASWAGMIGWWLTAPAAVVGDRVFFGDTFGIVYGLGTADGKEQWRVEADDKVEGGVNALEVTDPAKGKKEWRIFFGSHDFNLYSVAAETGEVRWKHETENYVMATPSIDASLPGVIFGGCDGFLHIINGITGEKLHKYVFQGIKTTDDEARDLANILKDQGAKKVCMTGYDYAYTTDLFEAMKSELGNIPITGEFLVKLGTNDFSTLIGQLQANECDAVLGALFSGGFVAFAKQAKPFGFFESKKVVWAASVASTEVTTQLKQDYPEGMWAGAFDFWYYDGSEAHKKFQDGIAKIEGTKETGMYALNGYRAMYFIAEAMKKAGSDDPDAVVAALEGLTIETPLGPVTMDAKTHRVDAAEFYGPVVTVAGSDVKRMSPINLVK